MPKKQKFFALTGSLIKPQLRYVTKLKIIASPFDRKGLTICEQMYRQAMTTKPDYLQPNFEYQWKYEDATMDGCKLDMEFVNGWKYVMSLAHVRAYDFNKHIEQLNDNIEF